MKKILCFNYYMKYLLIMTMILTLNSFSQDNFWQNINVPKVYQTLGSMVVNKKGDIFVGMSGSSGKNAYRTTDNGNTWVQLNINLEDPYFVINKKGYIFAYNRGKFFRSIDNGDNWLEINSISSWIGPISLNSNDHIYVGCSDGSISKSTDDGNTWIKINDWGGGIYNGASRLVINSSNHIYGATSESIYKSTDDGQNWKVYYINSGIFVLAINSKDHIFVGTKSGIFRSTDNGNSYTQCNQGLTFPYIYDIAFNEQNQVFAAIPDFVFRSTNNGNTWEQIKSGLSDLSVIKLASSPQGYMLAKLGNNSKDAVFRSTLPTILNTPTLNLPSNNATNIPIAPKLIWDLTNWATDYQLQLSTDSIFLLPTADQSKIVNNYYDVSNLQYNTEYYWRVRANNVCAISEWSEIRKFKTLSFGQAPNKPNKPSGVNKGKPYTYYSFTTVTTDLEGEQVLYLFDWGDGLKTHWSDSYTPGVTITEQKTWIKKGVYTIKVKAKDTKNNVSDWSDSTSILINTPPTNPKQDIPVNNAIGVSISPTLYWSGSDEDGDQLKYDVWLGSYFESEIKVNFEQAANLFSTGILKYYNTPYYWRIVARDGIDTASSNSWMFTTTISSTSLPPYPPKKPSGIIKGKLNNSYSFSSKTYEPNNDQMYYMFDWGDGSNSGWVGPINSGIQVIDSHSWLIKGIYNVKVKAKDINNNESEWSDNLILSLNTPPPQPTNISPSNNSTSADYYSDLSWDCIDDDKDLLQYDVYLGTTNPPVATVSQGQNNSKFDPGVLNKNATYYWKIVAKDGIDSSVSQIWKFTTGQITNIHSAILPNIFYISQNYPNPFNPNTRIEYSIPENCYVNLKVFDIYGKEIEILVSKNQLVGVYSITWQPKDFPSGVYYYRLQAGGYNEVKKMIYLR